MALHFRKILLYFSAGVSLCIAQCVYMYAYIYIFPQFAAKISAASGEGATSLLPSFFLMAAASSFSFSSSFFCSRETALLTRRASSESATMKKRPVTARLARTQRTASISDLDSLLSVTLIL